MAVLRSSEVFYALSISAEPKIFLHLSPNFGAVMLWATDMLRPATISGSSPRPIALKRVAHAIQPRLKPRNDPIASKDLPKKHVSPSEATCSVSFAQLSRVYNQRVVPYFSSRSYNDLSLVE